MSVRKSILKAVRAAKGPSTSKEKPDTDDDHKGKTTCATSVKCHADETRNKEEEEEEEDGVHRFRFTGIPRSVEKEKEDSRYIQDVSEIHSSVPTLVAVGKYYVKPSIAKVLKAIFDKHGDIVARCKLKSVSLRAYYLECMCSMVYELQTTTFQELTSQKIKEMVAVLNDVESVYIDVTWLWIFLNEVIDTFELSSEFDDLEAAKDCYERDRKVVVEELEMLERHLAEHEKTVTEVKSIIEDTRQKLVEIEAECTRLNKISSKIEKFSGKSILKELL